ncbi:MAG: hypothetical protein Q8Q17_00980, partial [bacterium]|nr:hypothetical protein [bacterium]
QVGVKYGEFASRLWQGDYWGVAVDFVKFKLGEEWDELVDMATKKVLSEGAQRMLGVFTALKDIGEWTGNKALEIQFNNAIKAGWQTYKDNYESTDLQVMIDIWWIEYGNNAKLNELGDVGVWKNKFAEVYALQNQVEETPVVPKEIAQVQKVIKKTAVVSFFKLKYPGIGENVAEELADAIVNKSGQKAIKQIAEKYKAHLDALTATGVKSETVSSSGTCGGLKKEIQERCVESVNFIIEQSRKVLSNEIPFRGYNTAFDAIGRTGSVSPGDDLLAPVKEAQTRIIKAAYENWFGKPIRDIEAELASIKEEFSRQSSRPETGRRGNPPDFSYKNIFYFKDDTLYQDFESGTAQKSYEIFVKDATAAQTANKAVLRFEKVELARMNSLLQSLSGIEARIASIDSSFDSAPGILSIGVGGDRFKDVIHIAREYYTVKWRDEITLMKDGKRSWWYFRITDPGINRIIKNLKETILDLENNLANEAELLVSIKKEYTDALERYPKIKKQKEEEDAKAMEALEEKFAERDRALAEEKAAEEKKTAENKSWWQKMRERFKNFTAEKETKEEAAKQKELEDRQELEKQGIKTFDVSTEEGREASEKSFEKTRKAEEEKLTKEAEEKKRTEAEEIKKWEEKQAQKPATQTSTIILGNGSDADTERGMKLDVIPGYGPCGTNSYCFWAGQVEGSGFRILDLGAGDIDNISSVSTSGYKEINPGGSFKPTPGNVYAIKTKDGKYGILQMQIFSGGSLKILWKYQSNGTNQFATGSQSAAPASKILTGYTEMPSQSMNLKGFLFSTAGGNVINLGGTYENPSGDFDFYWNDDGFFASSGGGLIDLGAKSLDSISSVPANGYSSQKINAQTGHAYAVKTRNGNYAAVEVIDIVSGWYQAQNINFKWKYQPDGSNKF